MLSKLDCLEIGFTLLKKLLAHKRILTHYGQKSVLTWCDSPIKSDCRIVSEAQPWTRKVYGVCIPVCM